MGEDGSKRPVGGRQVGYSDRNCEHKEKLVDEIIRKQEIAETEADERIHPDDVWWKRPKPKKKDQKP